MPKLKPQQIHYTPPAPVPVLPKKGYSVSEAAQIMGIGETNVRALIKEKRLRAVRVGEKGRGVVIPDFAIDEYFQREAS